MSSGHLGSYRTNTKNDEIEVENVDRGPALRRLKTYKSKNPSTVMTSLICSEDYNSESDKDGDDKGKAASANVSEKEPKLLNVPKT